jgi:hypothetical protein
MYSRFAVELPGFLRRRLTVAEARDIVRRGLAERETGFLKVTRRAIFDNPGSPYRRLLELARCEFADIERSVKARGLEATLRELRRSGVYFTFEEYKGRTPVVRDGEVVPVRSTGFDNPFVNRAYQVTTGGSTGAGTRVAFDLETMAAQVPHLLLGRDANGLLGAPGAIWRGALPDPTGIGLMLREVPYNGLPVRWFTPVPRESFRPKLKDRLATTAIVRAMRLFGAPCPWPEPLGIDSAVVLAQWAAEAVRQHGRCVVGTQVSLAVRICVAALEAGIRLDGVAFRSGGEPFTPARFRVVARTGARLVPHYVSVDTGPIGIACPRPATEDDLHLLSDCLALIQHPRQVLDSDLEVDAFYFTSLLPTAAKILLNVESDDYGIVEERSCGCPLEELGYNIHLRGIRSFGKLTGEGVTLVGSEMVHILEEVLPARFGGSPFDFQLLEEEDEHGLTRLTVLVSPRLSIESEEQITACVLEALGRSSVAADIARALWQQAGTLRVRRAEPVWTRRGKFFPIRTRDQLKGHPRGEDGLAHSTSSSSELAEVGTSR